MPPETKEIQPISNTELQALRTQVLSGYEQIQKFRYQGASSMTAASSLPNFFTKTMGYEIPDGEYERFYRGMRKLHLEANPVYSQYIPAYSERQGQFINIRALRFVQFPLNLILDEGRAQADPAPQSPPESDEPNLQSPPESDPIEPTPPQETQTAPPDPLAQNVIFDGYPENPYWDQKPEFFRRYPEGRLNGTRETIAPGVQIVRDIGMSFYVVKSGDTLSQIKANLIKIPEFEYLKDHPTDKLRSFNIRARDLKAGMLLPIPVPEEHREMSDERFANYCHQAVLDMQRDPVYGARVRSLVESVGARTILKTMIAAAKKEAGGRPIGQYELHRWENHRSCFSFSVFHVLMEGPGLRARRRLQMTEGQCYHPRNGAKLFLAFLIEKSGSRGAGSYLPLETRGWERFASFYNGTAWKRTNPDYVTLMKRYYAQAEELLPDTIGNPVPGTPSAEPPEAIAPTENQTPEPPPSDAPAAETEPPSPESRDSKPIQYATVRSGSRIVDVILNANASHGKWVDRPIRTNSIATKLALAIESALSGSAEFGNSRHIHPGDRIGIGEDAEGVYAIVRREDKETDKIRVP